MLKFDKLKEVIESNQKFIITTHVNPDADAIGSEIALYNILRKLNKSAAVINHSETPYNLEFMDTHNVIEKYNFDKHKNVFKETNVIFFLDLNQIDRVVSMEEISEASKNVKVCIDHHQDPQDFVDLAFIDTEYAATGEILFDFIKQTGIVELDYELAMPIYAAIMTDTGSFRFERTTSKTHYIAAELLEAGVVPYEVSDLLYDQMKPGKFRLLGEALKTLTVSESGGVAYMTITQEALKRSGAVESDVDGFVGYCTAVKGVKIGLLFFELKNGFKISFRSKGNIPINKLALEFNGGGHFHAAGTRLYDKNLDEYLPKIVETAEKYYKYEEEYEES